MTLRVRLEIVPHGDESKVYEIAVINISNMGLVGGNIYQYTVEENKYKTFDPANPMVLHDRTAGAYRLVENALAQLDGGKKEHAR